MSGATEFTIGSEVRCSDGVCGELRRVVVDPVARELTHLVVERQHDRQPGRLLPIDLVEATTEHIELRCSMSEFEALDAAEESHLLPPSFEPQAPQEHGYGYSPGQVSYLPYFGLALGVLQIDADPRTVSYDRVPVGEV